MQIAVTGALGHIGSKLIRSLPGHDLVLIDNFYAQRYCSLFNLPPHKFIEADIETILQEDLDAIFKGVDVVIHLAAITDAQSSNEHKGLVQRVNVGGTLKVAKACQNTGAKLIFPSTTSVYGKCMGLEVVEDPLGFIPNLEPQSPYAISKLDSEYLLKGFYNLKYVILRLGTIFGTSTGMRFHTAVNKFCFQAAHGQPVTVWRTAMNQNRPYLDLDDAIAAIKFVIDNSVYNSEIYNVVTLNTTVATILEIIRERVPVNVNYVDSEIMNQLTYTVSNKKFCDLRFKFTGDIRRGINETLDLLK